MIIHKILQICITIINIKLFYSELLFRREKKYIILNYLEKKIAFITVIKEKVITFMGISAPPHTHTHIDPRLCTHLIQVL